MSKLDPKYRKRMKQRSKRLQGRLLPQPNHKTSKSPQVHDTRETLPKESTKQRVEEDLDVVAGLDQDIKVSPQELEKADLQDPRLHGMNRHITKTPLVKLDFANSAKSKKRALLEKKALLNEDDLLAVLPSEFHKKGQSKNTNGWPKGWGD